MKSGCRSCALAAASSSALGINRRKITHTSISIWAMPVRSAAPIALRYSVLIRAWTHTKLIRQIALTVTWTDYELKSSNAAFLVMLPAANQRHAPSYPQSRGGSRWPRTIRIRQDASVTTAEPAIAVARDQVIDHVRITRGMKWKTHVHRQRGSSRAMRSTASNFTSAWPFATNAKESGRSGSMPSCSASGRPSAN
jgi:hypothetical protein